MEIELYNCPHCGTKGVIKTQDNLCPNCKQELNESYRAEQSIPVVGEVNGNINSNNLITDNSSRKLVGVFIILFGIILLILSLIIFVNIGKNDNSLSVGGGIALAALLAIAGSVICDYGMKTCRAPEYIHGFIRKLMYRCVVAYFFILGMLYVFSFMGP